MINEWLRVAAPLFIHVIIVYIHPFVCVCARAGVPLCLHDTIYFEVLRVISFSRTKRVPVKTFYKEYYRAPLPRLYSLGGWSFDDDGGGGGGGGVDLFVRSFAVTILWDYGKKEDRQTNEGGMTWWRRLIDWLIND